MQNEGEGEMTGNEQESAPGHTRWPPANEHAMCLSEWRTQRRDTERGKQRPKSPCSQPAEETNEKQR